MRTLERLIYRNWLAISIGFILTGIGVKQAYIERGYAAFGGEWLILPTAIVISWVIRDLIRAMVKEA